MKNKLILTIILVIITHLSFAQKTFISGGYNTLRMEESYLYNPEGFSVSIDRDITIINKKIQLLNTIQASFYISDINRDFFPGYFSTLSLSPKISYQLLNFAGITIRPFAGPFLSYLIGFQVDEIAPENTIPFNELRYGVDFGLVIDIKLLENTSLRLRPWSLQYGNDFYRQGSISLGITIH